MRIRLRDDSGLTLLELMVAVLILSVLLGVFYAFLFGGERAARDGRDWLEANQTARLALDRLSRELREADTIEIAEGSRVRFGADFDANGTIAATEVFTYAYDPASRELRITSSTATAPLAKNLIAFSFTYFGGEPGLDTPPFDGTVTATEIETGVTYSGDDPAVLGGDELSRMRLVVVQMTVGLRNQRHNYRTGIELRNLFS